MGEKTGSRGKERLEGNKGISIQGEFMATRISVERDKRMKIVGSDVLICVL
jgi:hypothetical protein